MLIIVIRLSIIWALLVFVVRLMGKRQIGEMQMSEFITAFMLSELAAMPVADTGIPLLFSVVPILMLGAYEIFYLIYHTALTHAAEAHIGNTHDPYTHGCH